MKTQFNTILTLAALAATTAILVSAQSTMNVKVDSMCSFQTTSWTMQEAPTTVLTSGGASTVRASVSVNVTKNFDQCSPKIYQALVSGLPIKSVTFTPDGERSPILTLNKVQVVQDQTTDNAPAALPTETVSFAFDSFSTNDAGPSSMGQTNASISIPDLSCTSSVSAWTIGATNPIPPPGQYSSVKAKSSYLTITKPFDSCSQAIVQALTTGKRLNVTLTQIDPATGARAILEFGTTRHVLIVGYQVLGSSSSGKTTETVSFDYEEITLTHSGSSGNTVATWNYLTGAP
jgi:type VI protein secretion system component Hcp